VSLKGVICLHNLDHRLGVLWDMRQL